VGFDAITAKAMALSSQRKKIYPSKVISTLTGTYCHYQ